MTSGAHDDPGARQSPHGGGRGAHDDPIGLFRSSEGVITGTVVCAAAIAYAGGHVDSFGMLTAIILGTVVVYWLAHLHAATIGSALTQRHHPMVALRHALRETWPIAGASVVPFGVLVVAAMFGVELTSAAWAALIATIALLTAYSYLAGVRGGLDRGGRIACAGAGAVLGLLVVLLKVALH
jgi:hypothetical protein